MSAELVNANSVPGPRPPHPPLVRLESLINGVLAYLKAREKGGDRRPHLVPVGGGLLFPLVPCVNCQQETVNRDWQGNLDPLCFHCEMRRKLRGTPFENQNPNLPPDCQNPPGCNGPEGPEEESQ